MKIPHLVALGTMLAASMGAAALSGCTSVNPAPKEKKVDLLPDDKNPWLQKGGLCEGVDLDELPPVAHWVDDFESDRHLLVDTLGGWAAYADDYNTFDSKTAPGSLDPEDPKDSYKPESKGAMHLYAAFENPNDLISDSDHWGINWQYEYPGGGRAAPADGRKSLDLSPYTGMVMWVRRGDTSASSSFTVQFPTPWTMDAYSGGDGSCLDDKAPDGGIGGTGLNGKCYSHMTYQGSIIDCWRPVKIYFNGKDPNFNLSPAFNPGPTGFDTQHVFGIEIAFSSSSAGNVAKYWPVNMWVDDMYLFKEEDQDKANAN